MCADAAGPLLASSGAQALVSRLAVAAAGSTQGAAAISANTLGPGAEAASYAARLAALRAALHASADAAADAGAAHGRNPSMDPRPGATAGVEAVLGALVRAWEEVKAVEEARAAEEAAEFRSKTREAPGASEEVRLCLVTPTDLRNMNGDPHSQDT